jgi:hypothetical protein
MESLSLRVWMKSGARLWNWNRQLALVAIALDRPAGSLQNSTVAKAGGIASINMRVIGSTDMFGETAMYILSFFIISLGGISLFIQKIYRLDEKGGQTVVDLPFIGRLTTNYPALGFVFIGAAMAIFTFSRTSVAGIETWFITGQFTAPASKNVDWQSGSIVVDPRIFRPTIYPNGTFQIEGPLERGRRLKMRPSK